MCLPFNSKFCVEYCQGSTSSEATWPLGPPLIHVFLGASMAWLSSCFAYFPSTFILRRGYIRGTSRSASCQAVLSPDLYESVVHNSCTLFGASFKNNRTCEISKSSLFAPLGSVVYMDGWYHWQAIDKDFLAQNTGARSYLINNSKKLRFIIECWP
jgi:hypothetical protein